MPKAPKAPKQHNSPSTQPLKKKRPYKLCKKAPVADPDTPPPKAKWTARDAETLVETLQQQKKESHQADSGWKALVWTACEVALRGSEKISEGGPKTASSCLSRWGRVSHMLYTTYYLLIVCYSSNQTS